MKNSNEDVLDAGSPDLAPNHSSNRRANSNQNESPNEGDHPSDFDTSSTEELDLLHARLDLVEDALRNKGIKGWIPTLRGKSSFSRLSTIKVAIGSALLLGVIAFFVVRTLQWNAALIEFRAEPGIHITSIRDVGLSKRQLIGLRDPLAPNPYEILRRHNISLRWVDLQLAEYHSLNTVYDRQRTDDEKKEIEKLRSTLIGVVGELSEENRTVREEKLGEISERLLEMRFPNEMKSVQFGFKNGVWHAEGDIFAREYTQFREEAPKYILTGPIDLENLKNYAHERSVALVKEIETIDLLPEDYNGRSAHAPRLSRYIKEYDKLRKQSGLFPRKLKLVLGSNDPEQWVERVTKAYEQIKNLTGIDENRIEIAPAQPLSEESTEQDFLSVRVSK